MTVQRVRERAVSFALGYLAGLALLLVWPERQTANQPAVLVAGTAIAILVGVTVEWTAFHHSPLEDVLAPAARPWRYSLPNAIGLFSSIVFVNNIRGQGPDWGLIAYAAGLALLLAGLLLSDLWWVTATRQRTAG